MSATLPLPDFHHERVETLTGRRSGLFIAVALHSSVLGSALGGARLWTYPHWSDGLGDALRAAANAADQGSDATIPLVARKGRASYLGERSAGHRDPGATSTAMLVNTAAASLG